MIQYCPTLNMCNVNYVSEVISEWTNYDSIHSKLRVLECIHVFEIKYKILITIKRLTKPSSATNSEHFTFMLPSN